MARARDEYLPLADGPSPDKAAENVLAHFRDEETRQTFYQFFREPADVYEILSPDAFLRPYLDDYDQLARMYRLPALHRRAGGGHRARLPTAAAGHAGDPQGPGSVDRGDQPGGAGAVGEGPDPPGRRRLLVAQARGTAPGRGHRRTDAGHLPCYPHWQTSAHQEREVRRELYGVLLSAQAEALEDRRVIKERVDTIAPLVDQIMRVAGRA